MQTIEDLKRKIDSTEDLQSVVRTMKAMAAVRIRQYEKAVEALREYNETVLAGLQAVFRARPEIISKREAPTKNLLGAVVFGSDQGMCGPLNDQVAAHALKVMEEASPDKSHHRLVTAVGERVVGRLEEAGQAVEEVIALPNSVSGITDNVQRILSIIEIWGREQKPDRILLIYSKKLTGASYKAHAVHLLPLDKEWMLNLKKKEWPTRCIPQFTMDWDALISALIRQYLFVSIFRAFAESLASENASRLASMQGAEKNVEESLAELNEKFHQKRQMSITEELLDIISGFEALNMAYDLQ
jgi:F-type H+-transporting ATPase subunit gamma